MQVRVEELLNEVLEENKSLFLIDLSISQDNKIRVILDGDFGITVEDCITVSRAVEHSLDREEIDFSLEVMSAGVSEGLKIPRQFHKNIGRTIKVKTADDLSFEGELTDVNDNLITIEWKAREPKPIGKGKVTVQKKAELSFDTIIEAKVLVKFN
ncbi:MAG: ribosome maturation factor RimP [Polaribacter sp.]|jgi:ribosome maturation factor RimP